MTAFPASCPGSVLTDRAPLEAAMSAYLGRYRGVTREHAQSGLRIFLTWCADQDLDPFTVGRADVERYVRWLQPGDEVDGDRGGGCNRSGLDGELPGGRSA